MTDTSPPIVGPDPDSGDPPDRQEQVQQAPAFGSQFYAFDLAEDTDGGTDRISLGTVSATDPDGGSVTYSIEGGNAAGLFEIDAASGELFYTGGGEDYETGSTSFELTVRASDGNQTTDATVTVSVTDVEDPVEVDPPIGQTVSEPSGEDFSTDPSTSGRVAVGDTATGRIGSSGDRDWFAVELVAGRTYVIDLRGSPTDDGTLRDPFLRGIYDADGTRISNTTDDDGGQGYNSQLTFTATESGTHYIAAGAYSGRGTYEVEVTDTSPPIEGQDPVSEDPPDSQEPDQSTPQTVSEPAGEDLSANTSTSGRVRRKAVHGVLAEVRRAWWRAVAGERALARLAPLMDRVRAALADSARIAELQVQSPVAALHWQRALLEAVGELERQRRESRIAKIELAVLVGLPPGVDYALAVSASMPEPRPLAFDAAELAALALAHRPELREGQLDERIAAGEVTKAMLRLLPGLELRAGAHTDSNSFLINSDWLSLGAAVSVNLTEIFTRPAAIEAARAGRGLAAARREALSMAVLAQLHVALASFEEARARHATADRIAAIERRILEVLRSRERRGAADRLQTVRAEIDDQRALLARDLGRAEVEDSFGRIFLAVGADIAPGGAATLADVAAAIAATEEAWRRGAIFIQPWDGTEAPADGGP